MTMNQALVNFFQGLILCNTLADPSEVKIVQDNCGKLTEEARGLVRLSYPSSLISATSPSRWDTCEVNPTAEDLPVKVAKDISSSCSLPSRRSSLVEGVASCSVDTIPHMPPRTPTQRSTRCWAIALDGLDFDGFSTDDDYSSSDSDSETTYTASGLDFDSDFSDSDSDDDDDDCSRNDSSSRSGSDCRWEGEGINAHEWTFPPNAILPNLQEMFREAALNRDVDINQRIKALAMGGLAQMR